MNILNIINEEILNINENPDGLAVYNYDDEGEIENIKHLHYTHKDAYPFASIEGRGDKVYIGAAGDDHISINRNYNIYVTRSLMINDGRIWLNSKIISFWNYPEKQDFKKIILGLEAEFKAKYKMNIIIWDDPNYRLEIRFIEDYEWKYTLIPLQQYVKSENPSPEEFQQHIQSPLLKKPTNVPQGIGSKRYGEKKPLAYRQAMQVDEVINEELKKLNF